MWELTQYLPLIQKILKEGDKRETRAGTAYSIFGETIEVNLEEGFPLLHGRKMFYQPVLGELAAMLRGPNNVADFKEFDCNYWDDWGDEDGALNLDYGNAWLDFEGVNQLTQLVETLKRNPYDRRLIVTGWRPDRLDKLSLPCCHLLYQWYVRNGTHLDMIWYQRSVDTMVGLPSDVVLGAAWNIILAKQCGYIPGKVKFVLGDTHIYGNHISNVLEYTRQVDSIKKIVPIEYHLKDEATVTNFEPSMLRLGLYESQPAIKFELNV